MINAGTNQHLEKVLSNLTEQESCYLRNCSSMEISYSLQNTCLEFIDCFFKFVKYVHELTPLASDIYLVFAGITYHDNKFVNFIK